MTTAIQTWVPRARRSWRGVLFGLVVLCLACLVAWREVANQRRFDALAESVHNERDARATAEREVVAARDARIAADAKAAQEAEARRAAEKEAADIKAREAARVEAAVNEATDQFARTHFADHQAALSTFSWQYEGFRVVTDKLDLCLQSSYMCRVKTIRVKASARGALFHDNVYGYPSATFDLYFNQAGKLVASEAVAQTK